LPQSHPEPFVYVHNGLIIQFFFGSQFVVMICEAGIFTLTALKDKYLSILFFVVVVADNWS
jgi:hypothetical protein